MINHTFVNARFIDTKHIVCEVLWRDNDDDTIIRSENVLREDGNTLWENLLKETTLEQILRNTFDYNKGEEEAFKKMVKEMYPPEVIIETNERQIEVENKSLDFEKLLSGDLEAEELFKLKILMFENEKIKTLKDKSLKSKIRKSKDALEIINLYYNAIQTSS
jgi:hypothetical protein